MCGRYISPDESAIEREFTLTGPNSLPLFTASFNVAPTQQVPAILQRKDLETWLSGTPEEAFACLVPYPDELRSAWPVSKRVNSPRNNDEKLIDRSAA